MTAAEITAFLVIECGVRIDIKDFSELTFGDPLVEALFEAWRQKQDRESERAGLICAVIANSIGGNSTSPSDFFSPMSNKTIVSRREAKEASLRGMFIMHNSATV